MDLLKSGGPYKLLPFPNSEFLTRSEFLEQDRLGLRAYAAEVESSRELSAPSLAGLWATLLMSEENSIREQIKTIPLIRYLSYGFLDPQRERDAFGVIVYSLSQTVDEGFFANYTLQLLSDVELRNGLGVRAARTFPIFVRAITEDLHLACHPTNGTSACFAKSRISSGSPIGPGALSVQHLIGVKQRRVSLRCCNSSKVLDQAPYGIDAMLFEAPCMPSLGSKRKAIQNVAPWTQVQFTGQSSGTVQAQVSDVTNTYGVFSNAHLPIRVFLDKAGQPGDSGSMVESTSLDPISLYMGEYRSRSGVTGGFSQHLFQVTQIMDMELYK